MPPNGCTPFPSTVVDGISVVLAAQLLGERRCRSIKFVPHIRSNEAEAFAHTSSIALASIALIKNNCALIPNRGIILLDNCRRLRIDISANHQ